MTGSSSGPTTANSQPGIGRPIRTGGSVVIMWPLTMTVVSVGPYVFQTSRPSATSLSTCSCGQASPPKISRRTLSKASEGQKAARVGTVETTVMSCSMIQSPSMSPARTVSRSAATRVAPKRQASHISSQEASKATDRPAMTRSRGPSGASRRNMRDSASTQAAADRCLMATPFGLPVVPEVKMIQASSSSPGAAGVTPVGGSSRMTVSDRSRP